MTQMRTYSSLGEALRDGRSQRGRTQGEVASAVGINTTYLSKLENNASPLPCSEGLLCKLADLYGFDRDDLIALAGRVPEDIVERLKGDIHAIKRVRQMFREMEP